MRPTSSRSLCLPPARTHFCELTARLNGGVSSPTKYGLNGTIPATLNSSVGSCGIRLADGTNVWSRAMKKSMNDWRSSSAVRGGVRHTCRSVYGRGRFNPVVRLPGVPRRDDPSRQRRARVGELRRPRRAAHVGVRRRRSCGRTTGASTAQGCKGVLDADATEMEQGCCSYGAHFVDEDDVANVVRHFVRLEPRHMQFYDEAVTAGLPRLRRRGRRHAPPRSPGSSTTRASSSTDPGSPRVPGARCTSPRSRPASARWTGSPTCAGRCRLRLEHSTDENGHVTSRLRDWKRRDWGEGSDDFHWWCTEAPDAYVGDQPVYRSARDEIVELVGEPVYDLLVQLLERARPGPAPADSDQALSSAARPRRTSVVVVGVVVELDAVLLGECCVLVFLGVSSSSSCSGDHDHRIPGRTPRDRTASACALLRSGDDDPSSRRAPKLEN